MTCVAVIGAGTMGHGIAHVAAVGGYDTTLADTESVALEAAAQRIRKNLAGGVERGKITQTDADAARDRIRFERSLEAAVGDAQLVVEAIVEDPAIKRALFTRLDQLTPRTTILASNTSSISIAGLAAATRAPERVLGMHFFNPVHVMKLVEIVSHERTDVESVQFVREVATRMGKEPIVVRDSPGFASSRLGVALGLEAMRMVQAGVATAEDIDRAMELGYGHPMGPLKVTDLVGLDVRLAITEYLHSELQQDHYAPPRILREKVRAGELGKKTGKGFYEWPSQQTS